MTTYVRKPVRVEAFRFGVEVQPQWFIDMTNAGTTFEDMVSFRCKKDGRLLKLMLGDYIILWDDVLWVCEGEKFVDLYHVALGDEGEVVEPPLVELQSIGSIALGGFAICIGIGFLYGMGWGFIALGVYAVGLGVLLWPHRRKRIVDVNGDTGGA